MTPSDVADMSLREMMQALGADYEGMQRDNMRQAAMMAAVHNMHQDITYSIAAVSAGLSKRQAPRRPRPITVDQLLGRQSKTAGTMEAYHGRERSKYARRVKRLLSRSRREVMDHAATRRGRDRRLLREAAEAHQPETPKERDLLKRLIRRLG